jgi:hypothetical protein
MGDGSQRETKAIFIAWERHAATVLGVILFPALAINSDSSRTMCHATVIQAVKQTVQLPKKHRDMTAVQLSTRVADSSRCIEYIINPLQYRVKRVKAVKTEDSLKPRSQCMKSGSTKTSDQCLPIGR